ncbi:hypothetical protein [Porphyromonas macacae]|nr:hypothetical protein [Porphyromonas macacae]
MRCHISDRYGKATSDEFAMEFISKKEELPKYPEALPVSGKPFM